MKNGKLTERKFPKWPEPNGVVKGHHLGRFLAAGGAVQFVSDRVELTLPYGGLRSFPPPRKSPLRNTIRAAKSSLG